MNFIKILIFNLFIFISNLSFSISNDFVILTSGDTLRYDNIEIEYYKRVVCQNENGKKKRINARKIIKVQNSSGLYESGRIVPLVLGWKRYLLLYRFPDKINNPEIVLYGYDGPSGGSMSNDNGISNGYIVTTLAVRNKDNVRGDFGKLSINTRKKLIAACPNCSLECQDIILNSKIDGLDSVYEIIDVVNKKCSE